LPGIIKGCHGKAIRGETKTIGATVQRYNFFIRFAMQYAKAGTNFYKLKHPLCQANLKLKMEFPSAAVGVLTNRNRMN
jgi:hypothetical protein